MIEGRTGGELEMGEGTVDVVNRSAQACGDQSLSSLHCGRPRRAQAAAGVGQRDQPGASIDGVALAANEATTGEPVEMVGEGRGRLPGPAGELARGDGLGASNLIDEGELLGRHTARGKLALEQPPGEQRRDAEALEDRLVGHVPIIGGPVV
jgi:hypothetical protein